MDELEESQAECALLIKALDWIAHQDGDYTQNLVNDALYAVCLLFIMPMLQLQ